jgi:hypothetical protein
MDYNEKTDIEIWKKYKSPVIDLLKDLRDQRLVRKTCRERLGNLKPARISEMISGVTDVSSYYVALFIKGRIMTIEQILQGKRISDLPEEDQVLFQRLMLDDEEVRLIVKAKQKGVSLKTVLKGVIGE